MAFQPGLISNGRRQELYDGFRPLNPRALQTGEHRQSQDAGGMTGPVMG